MSKEIEGNPIVQDTRKSRYTGQKELRFYAMFPYFNYGFFPQTWESPFVNEGKFFGDDDPLDVVELGTRKFQLGEQVAVRVLGVYCLVDQGEVDWKVLCLNEQEALEKNIKTFVDLENREPGIQNILKNWFKQIKLYDGKKENHIIYNESPHDAEKAIEVINQTHQHWLELVGKSKNNSGHDLSEKRKEFNILI